MIEKRNGIRRRIAAVREVQAIYMPSVPQLAALHLQAQRQRHRQLQHAITVGGSSSTIPTDHAPPSTLPEDLPEDTKLFLPSELPPTALAGCTDDLANIEERLRDAQLYDSLDKLRVQLHIKSRMLIFKGRNIRNQKPNLRAQRHLTVNESKIKIFAEKYRAAWRAKSVLAGEGRWQLTWKVLQREDVRTMSIEDDPVNRNAAEANAALRSKVNKKRKMLSEGRRKTSWIWLAAGTEEEDVSGMTDGKYYMASSVLSF